MSTADERERRARILMYVLILCAVLAAATLAAGVALSMTVLR